MPVPKDGAGQVSPPVPVDQDNTSVLGVTHHQFCFTHPHGALFGDMFGAGMAAGEPLGPRRAHGHLSGFGKGFLATGQH